MPDDEESRDDPLDILFLDNKPLDKGLLATLVVPYVRLYGEAKEIVFTDKWGRLSLPQKLLTYMLGRKALRVKDYISDDEEWVTAKQMEKDTRLNGNSIRPTLSRLLSEKLVKTDGDGKYVVPDYAIQDVQNALTTKGDK